MRVSAKTTVDEVVSQLLGDDRRIKVMIDAMELIRKPDSVKTLYNFIINEYNEKEI